MATKRLYGALVVVCLLVLSGCGATLLASAGGSDPYGPVNKNRTGIVRYLNQGAASLIDSRRKSAYKLMYEDCSGTYEIVGEGPRSSGPQAFLVASGGNVNAYYGSTERWYIYFRCVQQQTPPPSPTAAPAVVRPSTSAPPPRPPAAAPQQPSPRPGDAAWPELAPATNRSDGQSQSPPR